MGRRVDIGRRRGPKISSRNNTLEQWQIESHGICRIEDAQRNHDLDARARRHEDMFVLVFWIDRPLYPEFVDANGHRFARGVDASRTQREN